MKKACWDKSLLELIRRSSTSLPRDVERALKSVRDREDEKSRGRWALGHILENVASARENDTPLCQDTGTLTFFFRVPVGFDTNLLTARTRAAVSKATRQGYLRQNTVDAVSGASYDTNIAFGAPVLHFQQGARKTIDVRLVMKGGGCENVGTQYSLPDAALNADRDLEGVRRCIMDALWKAQGRGCSPGVVGVCIGGDRAGGYLQAKEQFLRKVGERSKVRALADLEERVLRDSRELGIGPMGIGGQATLLDVKIGAMSRLPASFFVTVSYMCWAFRRRGVVLGPEGGVKRWVY